MSGNVWEWCHDQFEDYSAGTHTNPIGVGSSYRIKRGGSWYGHEVYAVDMFCRVAYRGYSDSYGSHMGFRIAKTVVK